MSRQLPHLDSNARRVLRDMLRPGRVSPFDVEWFIERGPVVVEAALGHPIPTGILRLCLNWCRLHPYNHETGEGIAPILLNAWETALYDRTMEEKRAASPPAASKAASGPTGAGTVPAPAGTRESG